MLAPAYLADGVARPVRVGRAPGRHDALLGHSSTRRGSRAALPAAERASLVTAVRNDYSAKPFPADFWLDDAGRVRRVRVAYTTAQGTQITVDTTYSDVRHEGRRRAAGRRRHRRHQSEGPEPAFSRAPRRARRRAPPRRGARSSCRSPIAIAAQPRTLNGRRNAVSGMRTSSSSQSTGGTSTPSDRRDVEVDRRAGTAPARRTAARARSTSAGSTACASSSLPRTLSPYSAARAGNVARCDSRRLVEEERPGVGGRLGDLGLDDARAELLEPLDVLLGRRGSRASAGPPTDGGRVSSPTVSPASRGCRERRACRAPPTSPRRRRPCVAIGPTVSKLGQSGKTPSVGMRPQLRLQADDAAARRGQSDRAAGVGAEAEVAEAGRERGGVAARRAAGRAARAAAGSGPCRTTGSGS